MAGAVDKAGTVITARVADDSSNRGSRIGIRRDERTELGSLMVWVEFIVYFFPDELYD